MTTAVTTHGNGRPAPTTTRQSGAIGPVPFQHEELAVRTGERSGLYVVVAVHSTALGPALGGVRLWHYPSPSTGSADALRLAAGMTLKAAAAGLDLGGGKGVICAPAGRPDRRAAPGGAARLRRPGRVARRPLHHRPRTSGPRPTTWSLIRERTEHVTGLPPDRGGSGDPSPFTAIGVEAAIRACARSAAATRGSRAAPPASSASATWASGSRGGSLTRAANWCSRTSTRQARARRRARRRWAEPDDAMTTECDVLAPCALGGAINVAERSAAALRRSSAARPTTCSPTTRSPRRLADREILYAPDFIANAGGLIHVYKELKGYSERRAMSLVQGIEATLRPGCSRWRAQRGATPLAAARELAGRAARSGSCETDSRWSELLVVRLGLVAYEEGAPDAEGARGGAPGRRRGRRRGPDARAPAGLHQGPPLDRGRAADGRGLVPDAGHRGRRDRPRRPGHLPRARPARRLSDRGPARAGQARRRARVRAVDWRA